MSSITVNGREDLEYLASDFDIQIGGEPVNELASMFGISRSTLFRTLKVLKQQQPVSA